MALELGLKFSRTRAIDNATSVSELRISKNTAGPVFVSTETHSSFILTCYLKGYDRNSFRIKISEDGKEVSISGEKPLQEMLMMGRVMLKKHVQSVGFKKVFVIPKGVFLDGIVAKFDEDESFLKIVMPKLVKGICGVQIEEVEKGGFGESSQKAYETEENERVCKKEEGFSDKKPVESTNGDVATEKEIEGSRFEAMKKPELGENADHVPKNIGEESPEVSKEPQLQALKDRENIMLGRPPGTTREGKFEGTAMEAFGGVKFGNGGKDEEKVPTEMTKKGFEAIETSKEGRESKKVFDGKIWTRGKDKAAEIEQEEKEEPNKSITEDSAQQRVKDILKETQKEEIEETKFECEGRDEESVGGKISKEGLEAVDTRMERREPEKVLTGAFGINSENIIQQKRKKEAETKFEREGKDKERVGTEISKGGLGAIDTTIEGGESKELLADAFGISGEDIFEGKQKKEIQETKFESEGKDEERVETEISKGGLESIDEETKFECIGRDEERVGAKIREEGLEALDTAMEGRKFDKVLAGAFETSGEGILETTQKKENKETKFGSEGKDEERVRKEINKGGFEAIDTTMKRRESEKELAGAYEVDDKGKIDEKKQREVEKVELKTEGKDEVRVTTKEELEAIENGMAGVEPQKVHGEKIEVSKEGVAKGIKHKEIEDKDKERMTDIIGGRQRTDIQKLESETEERDKERVGTETSKEGHEEIERGESEMGHAESIGASGEDMDEATKRRGSEAAKFEIEGKVEEKVGTENNNKRLGAIESKIEGGESKKVLVGKIVVREEDIVEGTEQRETDDTKFEIEDRDKEKVEEVFKGTQEKEIGKHEFSVDAQDATIEGGVSEKLVSGATGVSGEDIVKGTKKGEIDGPKFENENRDEEMLKEETSNEEFEARTTKIKESPMQEPKLPIQLEESDGAFEGIERGEDKSEGGKLKKIEEPKFQSVEENSEMPKCATSKEENFEEIEEDTEAMAKRRGQEAKEVLKKVEGEEPKKMFEEARNVDGNDFASNSGKREIEESAVRSSRDGQHVQENIVSKVFEELGIDTAKLPKQMSKTKAQREKEVKVKEEVIVKREREVKEKEEVVVKKYVEAKEGFEKATNGDRIQFETGQPSEGRGFDEETLEAAMWDKNKALKEEGSVEAEPYLEKVQGESNDNVRGAIFSPNMKDDKRERTESTRKATEDPKIGTKHKAQHCVQELPMRKAESMDEREGPKDIKTEEMKEAKRKNEGTQAVADEESTMEEKIREADIDRIGTTNQFEIPEAKDQKVFGKGMREREIMMSTQQLEVKEIDKVCEEFKRSEANLEREKGRTTQGVMDEKLRRENAVRQVAESMQKAPEKKHPGKSEVEREVKSLEEKAAYPEHRKKVQRKNEVEGSRLKDLPPPKVKEKSLEPLESEKKNRKWKSPKTKKLVPEARGEEYEAGIPSEVKSSLSTQHSMVDEERSEIDFPKSNMSRIPSVEKDIEALQPNVLSDQNLEGKECFKTLTEDRGHYLLENEKRLETKKVAEEEKLNQKDEEERTKIAESKDEKHRMKRNGSEEINQIKGVAEEFRDVLEDNETAKSQEILLPQTAEIQGKEKIFETREIQQEKRREIPFHVNEESEGLKSSREVESQKPNAAHRKESSAKFSCDKPKGEVDKLQRKKSLSPSAENLSKGSSKKSRPRVKEDASTVENFPQFQEDKESTSLEGTKASEPVDKHPAEKLEVAEEGKIDECLDDRHIEFQEPEKQEFELDFQESSRRRSDLEVEKTHFSQQEDIHEGHAIEEEKAGEAENVAQVEITQESEDLEDIEVEASEKKVELCAPMVFAGSVFIASLIIFFFGHKGARKR